MAAPLLFHSKPTSSVEEDGVYEVLLDPHAARQLDDIRDEKVYQRIESALERLSTNPRPIGVKKLWDKVHRIHIGRFRIIYVIDDKDKVVLVSDIKPRTERTYRKLR